MVEPDFSRELKLNFDPNFLSVFPNDVEETDFFKDLLDEAGDGGVATYVRYFFKKCAKSYFSPPKFKKLYQKNT